MSKGKVYVQGSAYNGPTSRVFHENGYQVTRDIKEADIVAWTGGEDIDPSLYGEKPLPGTYYNKSRDQDDLKAVLLAEGKFLVGICRGAQLLNCIPNHGALWQDVDRHAGRHHTVTDHITGLSYIVNSLHHQMMRITPDAELVASTTLSSVKECYSEVWHCDNISVIDDKDRDAEVVWYPKTRSLLAQFHPEFGHPETTNYFFELMDRYWIAS